MKEGFDIDDSFKSNHEISEAVAIVLTAVDCKINDDNSLQLEESSRDVSDYVAGYIAHKARKNFKN